MKTILVKVEESLYERVKSFLEIMPKDSLEIVEDFDFSHIDYVSDDEQKDIESSLKDKESKMAAKSKTLTI